MALFNRFIDDFVGRKKTEEEMIKDLTAMGISKAEAKARVEMQLYAKEKYKIPESAIIGETTGRDVIIKVFFKDKKDAEFVLDYFPIDPERSAINGDSIIKLIRQAGEKGLTIVEEVEEPAEEPTKPVKPVMSDQDVKSSKLDSWLK